MAEAATRPCWRYAQDSAEPRAGVGMAAREKVRKGAEGRAGVREAAHGGGENGAKKIFFRGAFCGVEIKMTQ